MASFSAYLKRVDKETIFGLILILAFTFALDKFFSLQPPWPKGSTYITAFLELAVVFICFFIPLRSRRALSRIQIRLFIAMAAVFVLYFLLYSFFVFPTPRDGEFVVAGFRCTGEAANYVAPMLGQTCPFLTEEALAAAQYDVEKVWTPWSVRTVEFVMFLTWSSFFVLSTFLFGLTLAFLNRSERARAGATADRE